MGFTFWICLGLFIAMSVLFLPFYLFRTVRMLVDHYTERLLTTGVSFTTEKLDQIDVIRKSRETAGNQLSRLPGWMQGFARSKATGTIVDLLWRVLAGRLRLPLMLASWTYLLVLLIVSGIGIATLTVSSGISVPLLIAVTYSPGVLQFALSSYVYKTMCTVPAANA